MPYCRMLTSPDKEGLESQVNIALQQNAKIAGYAINPHNPKEAYTCLVQFLGDSPNFRAETGTFFAAPKSNSAIPEEICVAEHPTILARLEASLDRERYTFDEEVFQDYGMSAGELVQRYRVYGLIAGEPVGKGVAFDDIRQHGIYEAARRQNCTPRELWKMYNIRPSELSAYLGGSRRMIDYQQIAGLLRLSIEELSEVMNSKQRYDLRKVMK